MKVKELTLKEEGKSIKEKLKRAFKKTGNLVMAVAVICIVSLMITSALYAKAIDDYGISQGEIGQIGFKLQEAKTTICSAAYAVTDEERAAAIENYKIVANELEEKFNVYNPNGSEIISKYNNILTVKSSYDSKIQGVLSNIEDNKLDNISTEIDEVSLDIESMETSIEELLQLNINMCNKLKRICIVINVISILAVLVVAILLYRFNKMIGDKYAEEICTPIEEIKNAANQLAIGNLNTEINIDSDDEIGELAGTFKIMSANLMKYIKEISEVLGKISQGNLDIEIEQDYEGDFIAIKDSLNKIVQSLNEVFSKIQSSSNDVAASSEQVAGTAQVLAEASMEQANETDNLAGTMNEINGQVIENAKNAEKVNEIINILVKDIENGNSQMNEMLLAMENIEKASMNINNIINAIEAIASQTDLLALNAAIEAARAGEAGKGFAVVAEEVRVLANQSTTAANQSTELIKESIDAVGKGKSLADDISGRLIKIVKEMARASQYIIEITKASEEQAVSIGKVNGNVAEISSLVQSNSATAEESAASSEELTAQAEVVKTLIGTFNLKN